MDASKYPVTFAYGATDGLYYAPTKAQSSNPSAWIGPYHRGDDREMPNGTPVIVNGVQIGLSGNGNGRYGAHLHIGKFINGRDTNPEGQGFQLDGAVVFDVLTDYSIDPVNAKYVRIKDNSGVLWVYLHMSEVNVIEGQSLEGETEMTEDKAYAIVSKTFRAINDVDPEPANADYWAKQFMACTTLDQVSDKIVELEVALGADDYKGDPFFRYKGRHYNEDMQTLKDQLNKAGVPVASIPQPQPVVIPTPPLAPVIPAPQSKLGFWSRLFNALTGKKG